MPKPAAITVVGRSATRARSKAAATQAKLDKLRQAEADAEATITAIREGRTPNRATPPRPIDTDMTASPALYRAAAERKQAGKRGPGRKVTEQELDGIIRVARQTRPFSSRFKELEIAYWLDGIAVTRTRWVEAWDRADPPKETRTNP